MHPHQRGQPRAEVPMVDIRRRHNLHLSIHPLRARSRSAHCSNSSSFMRVPVCTSPTMSRSAIVMAYLSHNYTIPRPQFRPQSAKPAPPPPHTSTAICLNCGLYRLPATGTRLFNARGGRRESTNSVTANRTRFPSKIQIRACSRPGCPGVPRSR